LFGPHCFFVTALSPSFASDQREDEESYQKKEQREIQVEIQIHGHGLPFVSDSFRAGFYYRPIRTERHLARVLHEGF
jgi:hypothetical protein